MKAAGVDRCHINLETSRRYFPHICTTHTYQDKVDNIRPGPGGGAGGVLRRHPGDGGDLGGPDRHGS